MQVITKQLKKNSKMKVKVNKPNIHYMTGKAGMFDQSARMCSWPDKQEIMSALERTRLLK